MSAASTLAPTTDRPTVARIIALALIVIVTFALGLAAGIAGAFVHRRFVHLGPIPIAVGLLLALAGLAGLLLITGLVSRARYTLLAPTAGWLIPAFSFSVPRPEGDLIVTSSFAGYGFLLGGSIVIGLALAVPFAKRIEGSSRPRSAPHADAGTAAESS